MTHPDHASRVRHLGTVAGLAVESITLDSINHPERPRSALALNASTTWLRVGGGWWIVPIYPNRIRQWLDPSGSPWTAADVPELLELCGFYEFGEVEQAMLNSHHPNRGALAIRAAATRYAHAALDQEDTP